MTKQEELEELARLQRILEDVKEWGYGRIEIEIQDNKIVFAIGVKKYKF